MGTIYEIICWTTGLRYVGQTTLTLHKRLQYHENKFKCRNGSYYSSFLVLEYGNYEIYELEMVEDESMLNEREQYYIQHIDCVNIRDGSFDKKEYDKEYHEANREDLLEKMKEYYKANKEVILEKAKEKYTCECGSILTKQHKSRHEKSKAHQDYLKKKN